MTRQTTTGEAEFHRKLAKLWDRCERCSWSYWCGL